MSLETSRINRKPLVAILPWNLCSHYWRLVIPIWLPSSTAFFFLQPMVKVWYTGTTLDNIVKGSIIDINFALTSDLFYNTFLRRKKERLSSCPCLGRHPLLPSPPSLFAISFSCKSSHQGEVHTGTCWDYPRADGEFFRRTD